MLSDKRYYRWPRSSQQKRAIISSIEPLLQDYRNIWRLSHFNTLSKHSHLSVWVKLIKIVFTIEDNGKESKTHSSKAQDKQFGNWRLKITPVDYLLEVDDLTGKLMKLCINSVRSVDTTFEVSQF